MTPLLEVLHRRGVLAALDLELTRALARLCDERSEAVQLAVALASRQVREGHVCADLRAFAAGPILDGEGVPVDDAHYPALGPWLAALRASSLVWSGVGPAPLIATDDGRLYLARYHDHEVAVADHLIRRASFVDEAIPRGALAPALGRIFGPAAAGDRQRIAAMIAALRRLTIVTGGPGTGKTTTVVKIIALLFELARIRSRPPPRVLLVAPTGKAAARLTEAVERAGRTLALDEELARALPTSARTIHRALGATRSATRFRHHREHPLPVDLVVVDECSMVDIALMRRLLDAVPDRARLLLLGDEHQLASVEAGAVLGDICSGRGGRPPSAELRARVSESFGEALPDESSAGQPSAMADSIIRLDRSHRFAADRGVGRLADAIRAGDADRAMVALAHEPELELISSSDRWPHLDALSADGYRAFTDAADPAAALRALDGFRVLCAHRRGPLGVASVCSRVEAALAAAGRIEPLRPGVERWYAGRPVLVTRNDPDLELYNGDVGVTFAERGQLRVYFTGADGQLRDVAPARLPPHETVFATSIHKSQGSEFDSVAIVLPKATSPLCTRELLYTAVTRARHRVVIYGDEDAVRAAVSRPLHRSSGLAQRLWHD